MNKTEVSIGRLTQLVAQHRKLKGYSNVGLPHELADEAQELIKADSEENFKEELGDIGILFLGICDVCGYDPAEIIINKMKIGSRRGK